MIATNEAERVVTRVIRKRSQKERDAHLEGMKYALSLVQEKLNGLKAMVDNASLIHDSMDRGDGE